MLVENPPSKRHLALRKEKIFQAHNSRGMLLLLFVVLFISCAGEITARVDDQGGCGFPGLSSFTSHLFPIISTPSLSFSIPLHHAVATNMCDEITYSLYVCSFLSSYGFTALSLRVHA